MSFPFNIYLLALFGALLASAVSLPFWRAWCLRSGLIDDPGHRKIHSAPIPLAGGLAVMTGVAAPLIAGAVLVQLGFVNLAGGDLVSHGYHRRAAQLMVILLGATGMLILGWWDDKHELAPAAKFAGQLFVAGLVAASGIRITLFVDNLFFSYAVTVLWIVTVTNAFNFMDNMNGLCAGIAAIGSWCFAVSAAVAGQYLVALLALCTFGALLGFLPYNFPKATVFLGDSGSHLSGYLLAILAILPHFYSSANPNVWAVASPLLILAIPLADLVWVVLIRWRLGKPFYIGDNNHFSHRLVRRGLNPTSAVLLLWLAAIASGALSFLF